MKKIIYSLFVILALSCIFVSCSDDDGDAPAPAGNPAEAAAGTYTGTWCRVLNNDTVRGEEPSPLPRPTQCTALTSRSEHPHWT